MYYASFSSNGYVFIDDKRNEIFSEDKNHKRLFEYISKNSTHMSELLETYVSKHMNVETFELTNHHCDDDSREILEAIKSHHIYYDMQVQRQENISENIYSIECRRVFIEAIGSYFNDLLVRAFIDYKFSKTDICNTWYTERFEALAKPFIKGLESLIDEYYKKYKYNIGADSESEFSLTMYAPTEARGFSNELWKQKTIKDMLFWILDITTPGIGELTIPQRAWLYGNKFWSSGVEAMQQLSFRPATVFRDTHDSSSEVNNIDRLLDYLKPFNSLSEDPENVKPELLSAIKSIVDYVKPDESVSIYDEYRIDNLYQLLYLEVLSMIRAGLLIRRCRLCNSYFVAPNRKTAYCKGIAAGENESCSTIGSRRVYKEKVKADPALEMYERTYKTRYARVKRANGNDKSAMMNAFKDWGEEAKSKLSEVRTGKLDISAFEKWLKSN